MEEVETIFWDVGESDRGRGSLTAAGRRRRRPSLDVLDQILAAASIRRIYGKLLRLAKSRGRGRSPAETPLEFLSVLRDLFPYHQEEVETITRAYIEVQYGGRPDEEAGIAGVRRAWAALQPGAGPSITPAAPVG